MLVLHYVFAVVFILSVRVSSSHVSCETVEVGVAICISRPRLGTRPGTAMDNTLPDYCPWYRVTKYLESLRVVRWYGTAAMYGAKEQVVY